ncbi:gluconokinase [Zobellella iuensis]|uniref:Gluconokinase n=1 Tax=Zobellella iuensis TaxID=2803811 RepID=A0ABS1QN53_9GAMM|nr:gluconokinase [Zobellella iuensis]MBL1376284.1 gluconokinase [Zobellella iuensis]
MTGESIIVMGVTACGKSSVGAALARALGAKFIDGDDLHPRANILKMAEGIPLGDEDRAPWLERIRDAVFSIRQKGETGVIVCSALKRHYRDSIRAGNDRVRFLFLDGDCALILARLRRRNGHFMPESLLQNQFEVLERPGADEPDVTFISIDGDFEDVVNRALAAIKGEAHVN